jgi:signal transduction histidine kinase
MKNIKRHEKYFDSQEPNEDVLIISRKHWSYLATPFVAGSGLSVFAFVCFYLFVNSDEILFGAPEFYPEIILSLVLLFVFTYAYTSWLIRYSNVVILTNEHLVEIEQPMLYSRKVSVLDLDQIEDVTFGQHGLLETFLKFGDLEIQTAGEIRNFIFKNIDDAGGLQRKIMELKELEEGERMKLGGDSSPK